MNGYLFFDYKEVNWFVVLVKNRLKRGENLNPRVLMVAALLTLPCASVAWGQVVCDNPATAEGGNSSFEIELIGGAPSYYGNDVTFSYNVCQVGGRNALSHWIFVPNIAVADCYDVDVDGNPYTLEDLVKIATIETWDPATGQWFSSPIDVVIGYDPTTGLDGIKFDDLRPTAHCHRYTITFDTTKLRPELTLCAGCVEAATKAGNETIRKASKRPSKKGTNRPGFVEILGPVCCPSGPGPVSINDPEMVCTGN